MEQLTGGALGLNAIPQSTQWFDVVLAVGLTLYVLLRLARSRIGRTMAAIAQDETATELMGLNVRAYKLFSFVTGAGWPGSRGHSTLTSLFLLALMNMASAYQRKVVS